MYSGPTLKIWIYITLLTNGFLIASDKLFVTVRGVSDSTLCFMLITHWLLKTGATPFLYSLTNHVIRTCKNIINVWIKGFQLHYRNQEHVAVSILITQIFTILIVWVLMGRFSWRFRPLVMYLRRVASL